MLHYFKAYFTPKFNIECLFLEAVVLMNILFVWLAYMYFWCKYYSV